MKISSIVIVKGFAQKLISLHLNRKILEVTVILKLILRLFRVFGDTLNNDDTTIVENAKSQSMV